MGCCGRGCCGDGGDWVLKANLIWVTKSNGPGRPVGEVRQSV